MYVHMWLSAWLSDWVMAFSIWGKYKGVDRLLHSSSYAQLSSCLRNGLPLSRDRDGSVIVL